jgi:hypothetical protein
LGIADSGLNNLINAKFNFKQQIQNKFQYQRSKTSDFSITNVFVRFTGIWGFGAYWEFRICDLEFRPYLLPPSASIVANKGKIGYASDR